MTDLAIGQCTIIRSSILSSCTNLIRGCYSSIVSFILTQVFKGVYGFDNYINKLIEFDPVNKAFTFCFNTRIEGPCTENLKILQKRNEKHFPKLFCFIIKP